MVESDLAELVQLYSLSTVQSMLPFIDKILLYAVAQRASRWRYSPQQTPEGSISVRVEGQLLPLEGRVQTHNHIQTVQKPKVNHVCRQKMIG